MRLTFRLWLQNTSAVPIGYRKMVLSVIKELFRRADPQQYSLYFENNTVKPYCFATYLPTPKLIPNGFSLSEPRIDITFSTAEWADVALLHNGLLDLSQASKSQITYKDIQLKVDRLFLKPEPIINQSRAVFKTLSPIVVRRHDKEADPTKSLVRLSYDGIEVFNRELNRTMKPILQRLLNRDTVAFELNPLQFQETIIRVEDNPSDKKGVLFAHKGSFELTGDPEVLQAVYKLGLGALRGYGLGCVEIEK